MNLEHLERIRGNAFNDDILKHNLHGQAFGSTFFPGDMFRDKTGASLGTLPPSLMPGHLLRVDIHHFHFLSRDSCCCRKRNDYETEIEGDLREIEIILWSRQCEKSAGEGLSDDELQGRSGAVSRWRCAVAMAEGGMQWLWRAVALVGGAVAAAAWRKKEVAVRLLAAVRSKWRKKRRFNFFL
nr:zinc finger CCCH domain-containing protein 3 isoform X2 [Ipomoea batatas]GMD06081.1 zinc finger CCCH domain-containing protein 3 isoform X2 [Ipomoea batatas]